MNRPPSTLTPRTRHPFGRAIGLGLALLVVAPAGGCGDGTSSSMDAALPEDAALPADQAMAAGGNFYSLDGVRVVPLLVQCQNDIIAGSAADRTGFQFIFKGPPAPGAYVVEPAATRAARPMAQNGAVVSYGSDPKGGTKVEQVGQSGTVTVELVGGKLRAWAAGIPAKELTTMAPGTIAGDLTCP